MTKLLIASIVLLLTTAAARADRLFLVDGRSFTGTVTVQDDAVLVEVAYGTLRFSKDEVSRIEFKDTPAVEFRKKLSAAEEDDPDALFALVDWAREKGLKKEAGDLLETIIELDPDHAAARKALGHISVEGQWHAYDKAYELAKSKLEAGRFESLVNDVLPALLEIAPDDRQRFAVRELIAQTRLRTRRFAEASASYARLAEEADGPLGVRAEAIAGILKSCPDGMYVLEEPYPPTSALVDTPEKALKKGPASLAEPLVLQAAVRDVAKEQIDLGRKAMDAAAKAGSSDPDEAKKLYARATGHFDHADVLVPNISRSFRVEICRRQIGAAREDVQAWTKKFDGLMSTLGKENLSPKAYRTLIMRMVHYLDNIQRGLESIITIAKPYPRDLVLEIKWAQLDLKKIEAMRKDLVDELNATKTAVK